MYNHTDEEKLELCKIVVKHRYLSGSNVFINWEAAANELNEYFSTKSPAEQWRGRYRRNKDRFNIETDDILNQSESYHSKQWKDFLITVTEEEYGRLTETMIIKKMGLYPMAWSIKNLIANKWMTDTSTDKGTLYHGQLKVNLIPKTNGIDLDWLEEHLLRVKPNLVQTEYYESDSMLYFQFNDMHFGIMTYDDYYETMQHSLMVIESKHRDRTHYTIGGDLTHNNDLNGHTANLTPIEKVDMGKAVEDAVNFFTPLIKSSLENSNEVSLSWNIGNHDSMVSMMITRELRAIYPQCIVDLSEEEYKIINYGNVAIGITHGDLIGKNGKEITLHNAYLNLFPDNFTIKHNRYIFTEHYHKQALVDEWGTHVYTLSTKKKTDRWHKQKLFLGAKKQFTVFEFDKQSMIKEHRV